MSRKSKAFFITGTDTNVGKTVVSAILCKGMNAEYWKPVQSGTIEGTDSSFVREATNLPSSYFHQESYTLSQPLSPHLAAQIDSVQINLETISLPEKSLKKRDLIIEGAGGLMVPLNDKQLIIDLIVRLSLPVIVVARSSLGTINHSLLTINQLRSSGIPIVGVVLNGPANRDNAAAIRHYGQVEVIAQVEPLPEISSSHLQKAFDKYFGAWYGKYNKNAGISHLASVYTDENSSSTTSRQSW